MIRAAVLAGLAAAVLPFAAFAGDPPHDEAGGVSCLTCHAFHEAPGASLTRIAGNANLCYSCHVEGGLAQNLPVSATEQAVIGKRGTSHRWDSGFLVYSKWKDRKDSSGAIIPSGTIESATSIAYDLSFTVAGGIGTAEFDWTSSLAGSGSGIVASASTYLDENLYIQFEDGAPSPSFALGATARILAASAEPTDATVNSKIMEGGVVCSTCHNPHNHNQGTPFLRASMTGNYLCLTCHDDRDKGLFSADSGNVGTHPVGIAYATPSTKLVNNPGLPFNDAGTPGDPADDTMECMTCHGVHSVDSDTDGDPGALGTGDGLLLRKKNDDTLCTTCHTYPDHNGMGCTDCHNVHGLDSSNVLLIREWINGTQVTFVDRDDSDSQTDYIKSNHTPASYDGICEVCHGDTETTRHRNNPSGDHTHEAASACTDCHAHAEAFTGGGSCKTCHDKNQDNGDNNPPGGRRPIIGEFALASHHVQGATVEDYDCEVCHEMTQHKQGSVRLKDVDNPGTVVVLAADPAENATEAAKLTDFCLACHDGIADASPTPFSDGLSIPVIDPTDWGSGSHSGGSISCYGDGSGFGCHASGHGSEKRKLLAPHDAAPTAPANSEEEEGLCFNCHDSDGPAGTNISSLFTRTTRHPVLYADQSGTGRDAECTVCHDPHRVSSTPAHTDSNLASGLIDDVSGVNAGGSLVSTITYEYELCFLCHSSYSGSGSDPGDGGADTINKATQFNPSNATFHPVRAAQNNAYTTPSATNGGIVTMVAPWNQTTDEHDTMWCADCHGDASVDGPHGSNNPSMLIAGITAVDTGDGYYTPLCVQCHLYSTYVLNDSGSRFSQHSNTNHQESDWTGGYGGCLSCHYGAKDPMADVHGGNDTFAYMTGSRILDWSSGSCSPIKNSGNCKGHNAKSY